MRHRFEKANFEDPALRSLLEAHREDMFKTSPPESVHTLDWETLQTPDLSVWTLVLDNRLVGCGAIRELDATSGELKSMRVEPRLQRRGLGAKLLSFLESVAMDRGYHRLYLETGTHAFFEAAQRLYRRFGYQPCPPFGKYRVDPHSLCMSRDLVEGDQMRE